MTDKDRRAAHIMEVLNGGLVDWWTGLPTEASAEVGGLMTGRLVDWLVF
jgi:hypothetical protein